MARRHRLLWGLLAALVSLALACGGGDEGDEGAAEEGGGGDASAEHIPTGLTGATAPPAGIVKLVFIHHSTGENWLQDGYGDLGLALRENNYYVSDTNYGWGPDAIGDTTDIGHFWTWFRSGRSGSYLSALYAESRSHASYSRRDADPGGANEIVLFKSCFPNSALRGSASEPTPPIGSNALRGESADSDAHTLANAKGIYQDLLGCFGSRPDKLFVLITAPPLSASAHSANARALNNWLVRDWLSGYSLRNVAVFDFYNVLTSNGGDAGTHDLGRESGNHHRYWNGSVQHVIGEGRNTSAYASGRDDDHPTAAGSRKATGEFVPLLNYYYRRFKS